MNNEKKYDINISVRTTYLPEQSDEEADRHVFSYTITISNTGNVASQLISRHWIITSGDDNIHEVRGLGVVGEQPLIKPGDTFEYTSGTTIPSLAGTMKGSYQMVAEDGFHFTVDIPEFILSVPRVLH
ncbi:Co2+/Mg2+ efflux protein ApaG [Nitrosomonas communis]|jgi:ApaG protein|uniref:Protein ApaG n=1 Tax=Nitrosomonas communis TaxID=44574 RepID=A0A1I4RST2_9PROT|nr:Co2+/Mg2+ efflux protein ApaG [Nitrosomonas communis]SFM55276.1 ApaG protein [Nitrosomonas communis]